jgi:predicted nucleotidyltransferase
MLTPAEKYKDQILIIIFQFFNKNEIEIILFGSMATHQQTKFSDIDIGILDLSNSPQFDSQLKKVNEALEESRIPYKIDVINLNLAKDEFKKIALKNRIIWHQKK